MRSTKRMGGVVTLLLCLACASAFGQPTRSPIATITINSEAGDPVGGGKKTTYRNGAGGVRIAAGAPDLSTPYPAVGDFIVFNVAGNRVADISMRPGFDGLTEKVIDPLVPGKYCATQQGLPNLQVILPFVNANSCPKGNGVGSFDVKQSNWETAPDPDRGGQTFYHLLRFEATFSYRCAAAGLTGSISWADGSRKDGKRVAFPSFSPAACEVATLDENPLFPTADLPRSGTMSLTLTAENGSTLGGVIAGRTYRYSSNDGPWTTYLRDPLTEAGGLADWGGTPPNHLELSFEPTKSKELNNPIFSISLKQLHEEGLQTGSFAFDDKKGIPHLQLQLNLLFCAGGVTSSYTVDEFSYDCEFASGGLPGVSGEPNKTVHVVPHLRTLTVTFKTKCGDQKGGYHGTLTVTDTPGFDCAFPPTTGGGSGTGGTGGDSGGGTGGDTGGSTGGTPTSPASGATVVVPESARSGIQLNNQQSVTVDLSTAIPSGFDGPVELAAFSEPEGLAVSLSKSVIGAPGTGTFVLTIAAGADTRPQDYRVLISATGNGVTTYGVINVSVFCDPPVILGIDQPRNVTINSGASTTLEAKTIGSGPTVYQWYSGQSGATQTPIAGATSRTFNTGALTSTKDYWVRATNPCGSVDSNTVTVTVH